VPDQNDLSADFADPGAPDATGLDTALHENPSSERITEPMLDVHPPHHAEPQADVKMMTINQERFEDQPR
jgi:hypothetical protein